MWRLRGGLGSRFMILNGEERAKGAGRIEVQEKLGLGEEFSFFFVSWKDSDAGMHSLANIP